MICQSCGVEAPTKKVMFVRHIGMIVMFQHARIGGEFCRKCVNKYFLQYGGTTLVAGWWGVISMFATPVVLLIDVFNYLRVWNLPPVPEGAGPPRLNDQVVARLQPLTPMLVSRLNAGEPLKKVVTEIADKAVATPGQVQLYIRMMAAKQKDPLLNAPIANMPMTGRP